MSSRLQPLVRRLLPALALALAACGKPAGPPPAIPAGSNILLITIDTLRADHLSSYGYARATSPVIDALAAGGVRFDQPVVQWPKTGPSFASIFTATYPKDNGIVRQVGIPLPLEFRMLAEVLEGSGYQTVAVVANGALASEFHFDQGFGTFVEAWKLPPEQRNEDPVAATAITRLAKQAMAHVDRDRPYFAWIHYLDPHFPYTPPGEWRDRFQHDELFDPTTRIDIARDSARRQMVGIGREQVVDGHDELAFYVARYDAEIAYADAQIGDLLDYLKNEGLLARTLTVVSSDHGESLGEHYYFFDHGRFGFQTCLRVPLVFHYPGVVPTGVVTEPTELIDLAPTLLEAAGVALEGGRWMQGRSLLGRLLGGPAARGEAPRPAFAEAGYATGGEWQKIVRDGRFKLIHAPKREENRWIGGVDVPWALYDLAADPGETDNVADRFPGERQRLEELLTAWNGAEPFPVLVDATTGKAAEEMDAETREQLKALGYIQ